MFLRRAAPVLVRRTITRPHIARSFAISARRYDETHNHQSSQSKGMKPFEEVTGEHDLLPPGAQPGTIPTDLEQATGLERLEILGKMQGIDIFDMTPLDASRKGTLDNPIVVRGFGDEQYVGCTGSPADSHGTIWLAISRARPSERCPECGSAYLYEYVGPADDGHGHGHGHGHGEVVDGMHNHEQASDGHTNIAGDPVSFADFVKPEYRET